MVNIEIDGIYCPKCRELHPTLFWHHEYNEYLMPRHCYDELRAAGARFGYTYSDEECQEMYQKRLDFKQIKLMKHAGECAICSAVTSFIAILTEQFVCSDECLSYVNSTPSEYIREHIVGEITNIEVVK